MKKKVLSLVLGTAMAASMFAACGSSTSSNSSSAASSSSAADSSVASASAGTTEDVASNSAAATTASGDGSVYLLNFKPETDDAWQDLAKTYTDQTGVKVNVLTAADGQYATTLQSEMAKSEAPTIFNIGSSTDAQTWDDYTYDLKDTDLYKHDSDHSLDVVYNGKVAGIANCYEAYGIIVNKTILDTYCSLDNAVISSIDDIDSFDKLKAVADDIQKRVDEINKAGGYDLTGAFTSAGLDDSSSWRFSGHLANMPLYYEFVDDGLEDPTAGEATIKGKYLDNYKKVWDMYVSDSGADPKTLAGGTYNAEQEFGMEEAVFYQNGDWEYSALKDADGTNGYLTADDDLTMIPIYFGVDDKNEGLCVGTENHWAVNSKASEADIKASLDFLNWVITSDEGRTALDDTMGLSCPFDTFTDDYAPKNEFGAVAQKLNDEGKKSVAWAFNATPNVDDWRADVVAALTAYTDGTGDWDAVKTAFVDGWANQWKLQQESASE
ncbi:MAG: ABC transporter substrate-binding protein [Bilifractor sp.]|nr:ABC transporter substrate-binding protein [Lachnospiraceae bacterium]MDY2837664.1 ABC transporter substrate-binding protein [Bilifractor sp.]